MGRLDDAQASYTQAIALKPDFVEAHSNLGNTLKELGRLDEAVASYRHAIMLKPNLAEAHHNLGNALKELGRLDAAEASYRCAIVLKPNYAEAQYNLGATLQQLGRLEESEASYRHAIALKSDYAEAKHMLASLTGETTHSAPRTYVENLFDEYASKFDHSLVDNLEYKIPKKIVEMILKNHSGEMLGSILDLGCGTGLTGVEIKKYCMNIEGIDLSARMLEKARKKNVYDRLTNRDIVDYLSTENLNFDYFISTDVFIYVGDLCDVFRLIKSRNSSGGKLVFSTEHTDKHGFFLQKTGRYSHSKTYIESLCEQYNYTLSHFEIGHLRKDKDIYITGGLYLLDF
jgi:predicted TPR repeat methyltransferase